MCRARWTVLWQTIQRIVQSGRSTFFAPPVSAEPAHLGSGFCAASVARLATIQHDAAPNCNQSPGGDAVHKDADDPACTGHGLPQPFETHRHRFS